MQASDVECRKDQGREERQGGSESIRPCRRFKRARPFFGETRINAEHRRQ
jgi:hypothetical protein